MNAWLGRHIILKRAISGVLTLAFCVCFVLSDAWALSEQGSVPVRTYLQPKNPKFASLDSDSFTIPSHLGEIKYSFKGDSDNVVVHIQDAHCNYYAQEKIAEIIEYLTSEYGLKVINLEGGVGEYDTGIFTSISDPLLRKEVAGYFVKKGEINGAELYAINNPGNVRLWGIEEEELYLANLQVYRDSLEYRDRVEEWLSELTHVMNDLKRHIYRPELLKIDMAYNAYKAGNMDFRDYLDFLLKTARERSIAIEEFPNLYMLQETIEMEESIDFKKADKERNVLIDELKDRMSKNEIKELVSKSVEFKTKRLSRNAFYGYLLRKARVRGLNMATFPELSRYLAYITSYESVDRYRIMEEVGGLESRIKESLYQNDTQRELDKLSKNLALLKNIFAITLVRADYMYYKQDPGPFSMNSFLEFIEREAPKYKIKARPDPDIVELDYFLERIIKFYDYSFRRDEVFLENIQFEPVEGGVNGAILMTGGFHTENLYELFKENGISYVSIFPKFTSEKGYQSTYYELLAGESSGIQNILRPVVIKEAMLQIASKLSSLGKKVYGDKEVYSFQTAVVLLSKLREARRDDWDDISSRIDSMEITDEDGMLICRMPGKIQPIFQIPKSELPLAVSSREMEALDLTFTLKEDREYRERERLIKDTRSKFKKGLAQLKQKLEDTKGEGMNFGREYSDLLDDVVRSLSTGLGMDEDFTFVAMGSYARRATPYGTDIDLFLLIDDIDESDPARLEELRAKAAEFTSIMNERVADVTHLDFPGYVESYMVNGIYCMSEKELKGLHRTIEGRERQELATFTALLDYRHIKGAKTQAEVKSIFEKVKAEHDVIGKIQSPEMEIEDLKRLLPRTGRITDEEIYDFNVKKGIGGQRVIDVLIWRLRCKLGMAYADWETEDGMGEILEGLTSGGVITALEAEQLKQARTFLATLRSNINFYWEENVALLEQVASRKEVGIDEDAEDFVREALTKENVEEVARRMGTDEAGLVAAVRENSMNVTAILERYFTPENALRYLVEAERIRIARELDELEEERAKLDGEDEQVIMGDFVFSRKQEGLKRLGETYFKNFIKRKGRVLISLKPVFNAKLRSLREKYEGVEGGEENFRIEYADFLDSFITAVVSSLGLENNISIIAFGDYSKRNLSEDSGIDVIMLYKQGVEMGKGEEALANRAGAQIVLELLSNFTGEKVNAVIVDDYNFESEFREFLETDLAKRVTELRFVHEGIRDMALEGKAASLYREFVSLVKPATPGLATRAVNNIFLGNKTGATRVGVGTAISVFMTIWATSMLLVFKFGSLPLLAGSPLLTAVVYSFAMTMVLGAAVFGIITTIRNWGRATRGERIFGAGVITFMTTTFLYLISNATPWEDIERAMERRSLEADQRAQVRQVESSFGETATVKVYYHADARVPFSEDEYYKEDGLLDKVSRVILDENRGEISELESDEDLDKLVLILIRAGLINPYGGHLYGRSGAFMTGLIEKRHRFEGVTNKNSVYHKSNWEGMPNTNQLQELYNRIKPVANNMMTNFWFDPTDGAEWFWAPDVMKKRGRVTGNPSWADKALGNGDWEIVGEAYSHRFARDVPTHPADETYTRYKNKLTKPQRNALRKGMNALKDGKSDYRVNKDRALPRIAMAPVMQALESVYSSYEQDYRRFQHELRLHNGLSMEDIQGASAEEVEAAFAQYKTNRLLMTQKQIAIVKLAQIFSNFNLIEKLIENAVLPEAPASKGRPASIAGTASILGKGKALTFAWWGEELTFRLPAFMALSKFSSALGGVAYFVLNIAFVLAHLIKPIMAYRKGHPGSTWSEAARDVLSDRDFVWKTIAAPLILTAVVGVGGVVLLTLGIAVPGSLVVMSMGLHLLTNLLVKFVPALKEFGFATINLKSDELETEDRIVHAEGMRLAEAAAISKRGEKSVARIKTQVKRNSSQYIINGVTVYLDNDLIEQYASFGFKSKEDFLEALNNFMIDELSAHPPLQKELVISVIDTGESIFEDHLGRGFIGIHRSLFEKLAGLPKTALKLLNVGLKHGLLHEALYMERRVLTDYYQRVEGAALAQAVQKAEDFITENRADLKDAMQRLGLWDEVEQKMLEEDLRNAEMVALDVKKISETGLLPEMSPFVYRYVAEGRSAFSGALKNEIEVQGAKFGIVDEDSVVYKEIDDIFQEILKAAGLEEENIRLYLVNSDDVNAFWVTDSRAFFLSVGFIKTLNKYLNENGKVMTRDMIAWVLAHELRHMVQHLEGAEDIADMPTENRRMVAKNREYDADTGGLFLAAFAGFNPSAAVAVIEFLDAMEGINYLSDHPPADNRKGEVQKILKSPDQALPNTSKKEEEFRSRFLEDPVIKDRTASERFYQRVLDKEDLDGVADELETETDPFLFEELLMYYYLRMLYEMAPGAANEEEFMRRMSQLLAGNTIADYLENVTSQSHTVGAGWNTFGRKWKIPTRLSKFFMFLAQKGPAPARSPVAGIGKYITRAEIKKALEEKLDKEIAYYKDVPDKRRSLEIIKDNLDELLLEASRRDVNRAVRSNPAQGVYFTSRVFQTREEALRVIGEKWIRKISDRNDGTVIAEYVDKDALLDNFESFWTYFKEAHDESTNATRQQQASRLRQVQSLGVAAWLQTPYGRLSLPDMLFDIEPDEWNDFTPERRREVEEGRRRFFELYMRYLAFHSMKEGIGPFGQSPEEGLPEVPHMSRIEERAFELTRAKYGDRLDETSLRILSRIQYLSLFKAFIPGFDEGIRDEIRSLTAEQASELMDIMLSSPPLYISSMPPQVSRMLDFSEEVGFMQGKFSSHYFEVVKEVIARTSELRELNSQDLENVLALLEKLQLRYGDGIAKTEGFKALSEYVFAEFLKDRKDLTVDFLVTLVGTTAQENVKSILAGYLAREYFSQADYGSKIQALEKLFPKASGARNSFLGVILETTDYDGMTDAQKEAFLERILPLFQTNRAKLSAVEEGEKVLHQKLSRDYMHLLKNKGLSLTEIIDRMNSKGAVVTQFDLIVDNQSEWKALSLDAVRQIVQIIKASTIGYEEYQFAIGTIALAKLSPGLSVFLRTKSTGKTYTKLTERDGSRQIYYYNEAMEDADTDFKTYFMWVIKPDDSRGERVWIFEGLSFEESVAFVTELLPKSEERDEILISLLDTFNPSDDEAHSLLEEFSPLEDKGELPELGVASPFTPNVRGAVTEDMIMLLMGVVESGEGFQSPQNMDVDAVVATIREKLVEAGHDTPEALAALDTMRAKLEEALAEFQQTGNEAALDHAIKNRIIPEFVHQYHVSGNPHFDYFNLRDFGYSSGDKKFVIAWRIYKSLKNFFNNPSVSFSDKLGKLMELFPDSTPFRDNELEKLIADEEGRITGRTVSVLVQPADMGGWHVESYELKSVDDLDFSLLTAQQAEELTNLYKRLLPLMTESTHQIVLGRKIFELQKRYFPETYTDFERGLEEILTIFPKYSLARDSVLNEFINLGGVRNMEQYRQVSKYILEDQRLVEEVEIVRVAQEDEMWQMIAKFPSRKEKAAFVLWVLSDGKSPMPSMLEKLTRDNHVNFDTMPSMIMRLTKGEREKFFSNILRGKNGLFEVDPTSGTEIMEEFFQELFSVVFPAGELGGMEAVLRGIFISVFMNYSTERRILLFNSILNSFSERGGKSAPRGEKIRTMLEQMGVVGVKLGQYLAEQTQLFGEEGEDILTELRNLQKDAAPFHNRAIFQLLQEAGLLHRVVELKERIGAASIKQVYEVILDDGTIVAAKFMRPAAEKFIDEDLLVLKETFAMLGREHPDLGLPVNMLDDIEKRVREELQFEQEADNARRFKENLKVRATTTREGHFTIKTPEVHHHSAHVILEENVRGVTLRDLILLKKDKNSLTADEKEKREKLEENLRRKFSAQEMDILLGYDIEEIEEALTKEFFREAFGEGFFHADLHLGNAMLTPEREIYMIDLGASGSVGQEQTQSFLMLLIAIYSGKSGWAISHLNKFLGRRADSNKETLRAVSSAIKGDMPLEDKFKKLIYILEEEGLEPDETLISYFRGLSAASPLFGGLSAETLKGIVTPYLTKDSKMEFARHKPIEAIKYLARRRIPFAPASAGADFGIASTHEAGWERKTHEYFHHLGKFNDVIGMIAYETGATDLPKIMVGDEEFYDLRGAVSKAEGKRISLHDERGNETGEIRIEKDGTLVIIDSRFEKDHAGRGQQAVYARTEAKAQHELRELRDWTQFALNIRITLKDGSEVQIATEEDISRGRLGVKLRDYFNGRGEDLTKEQLIVRQSDMGELSYRFHMRGRVAEDRALGFLRLASKVNNDINKGVLGIDAVADLPGDVSSLDLGNASVVLKDTDMFAYRLDGRAVRSPFIVQAKPDGSIVIYVSKGVNDVLSAQNIELYRKILRHLAGLSAVFTSSDIIAYHAVLANLLRLDRDRISEVKKLEVDDGASLPSEETIRESITAYDQFQYPEITMGVDEKRPDVSDDIKDKLSIKDAERDVRNPEEYEEQMADIAEAIAGEAVLQKRMEIFLAYALPLIQAAISHEKARENLFDEFIRCINAVDKDLIYDVAIGSSLIARLDAAGFRKSYLSAPWRKDLKKIIKMHTPSIIRLPDLKKLPLPPKLIKLINHPATGTFAAVFTSALIPVIGVLIAVSAILSGKDKLIKVLAGAVALLGISLPQKEDVTAEPQLNRMLRENGFAIETIMNPFAKKMEVHDFARRIHSKETWENAATMEQGRFHTIGKRIDALNVDHGSPGMAEPKYGYADMHLDFVELLRYQGSEILGMRPASREVVKKIIRDHELHHVLGPRISDITHSRKEWERFEEQKAFLGSFLHINSESFIKFLLVYPIKYDILDGKVRPQESNPHVTALAKIINALFEEAGIDYRMTEDLEENPELTRVLQRKDELWKELEALPEGHEARIEIYAELEGLDQKRDDIVRGLASEPLRILREFFEGFESKGEREKFFRTNVRRFYVDLMRDKVDRNFTERDIPRLVKVDTERPARERGELVASLPEESNFAVQTSTGQTEIQSEGETDFDMIIASEGARDEAYIAEAVIKMDTRGLHSHGTTLYALWGAIEAKERGAEGYRIWSGENAAKYEMPIFRTEFGAGERIVSLGNIEVARKYALEASKDLSISLQNKFVRKYYERKASKPEGFSSKQEYVRYLEDSKELIREAYEEFAKSMGIATEEVDEDALIKGEEKKVLSQIDRLMAGLETISDRDFQLAQRLLSIPIIIKASDEVYSHTGAQWSQVPEIPIADYIDFETEVTEIHVAEDNVDDLKEMLETMGLAEKVQIVIDNKLVTTPAVGSWFERSPFYTKYVASWFETIVSLAPVVGVIGSLFFLEALPMLAVPLLPLVAAGIFYFGHSEDMRMSPTVRRLTRLTFGVAALASIPLSIGMVTAGAVTLGILVIPFIIYHQNFNFLRVMTGREPAAEEKELKPDDIKEPKIDLSVSPQVTSETIEDSAGGYTKIVEVRPLIWPGIGKGGNVTIVKYVRKDKRMARAIDIEIILNVPDELKEAFPKEWFGVYGAGTAYAHYDRRKRIGTITDVIVRRGIDGKVEYDVNLRGRGFGKLLFDIASEELKSAGSKKIILERVSGSGEGFGLSVPMLKMARSFGFKPVMNVARMLKSLRKKKFIEKIDVISAHEGAQPFYSIKLDVLPLGVATGTMNPFGASHITVVLTDDEGKVLSSKDVYDENKNLDFIIGKIEKGQALVGNIDYVRKESGLFVSGVRSQTDLMKYQMAVVHPLTNAEEKLMRANIAIKGVEEKLASGDVLYEDYMETIHEGTSLIVAYLDEVDKAMAELETSLPEEADALRARIKSAGEEFDSVQNRISELSLEIKLAAEAKEEAEPLDSSVIPPLQGVHMTNIAPKIDEDGNRIIKSVGLAQGGIIPSFRVNITFNHPVAAVNAGQHSWNRSRYAVVWDLDEDFFEGNKWLGGNQLDYMFGVSVVIQPGTGYKLFETEEELINYIENKAAIKDGMTVDELRDILEVMVEEDQRLASHADLLRGKLKAIAHDSSITTPERLRGTFIEPLLAWNQAKQYLIERRTYLSGSDGKWQDREKYRKYNEPIMKYVRSHSGFLDSVATSEEGPNSLVRRMRIYVNRLEANSEERALIEESRDFYDYMQRVIEIVASYDIEAHDGTVKYLKRKVKALEDKERETELSPSEANDLKGDRKEIEDLIGIIGQVKEEAKVLKEFYSREVASLALANLIALSLPSGTTADWQDWDRILNKHGVSEDKKTQEEIKNKVLESQHEVQRNLAQLAGATADRVIRSDGMESFERGLSELEEIVKDAQEDQEIEIPDNSEAWKLIDSMKRTSQEAGLYRIFPHSLYLSYKNPDHLNVLASFMKKALEERAEEAAKSAEAAVAAVDEEIAVGEVVSAGTPAVKLARAEKPEGITTKTIAEKVSEAEEVSRVVGAVVIADAEVEEGELISEGTPAGEFSRPGRLDEIKEETRRRNEEASRLMAEDLKKLADVMDKEEDAKSIRQMAAAVEAEGDLLDDIANWVITPMSDVPGAESAKGAIEKAIKKMIRKTAGHDERMRMNGYFYSDDDAVLKENLRDVFVNTLMHMADGKFVDKDPRAMAFVPQDKYDLAMEVLSEIKLDNKDRLTIVMEKGIHLIVEEKGKQVKRFVSEMSHVDMGREFLNYGRMIRKPDDRREPVKERQVAERIVAHLKTLVIDPSAKELSGDPTLVMKNLLDGKVALPEMGQLDFEAWKEEHKALLAVRRSL